MTEQERPRTEAGRAFVAIATSQGTGLGHLPDPLPVIVARIEDEGRQQAVDLLREWIEHHQPEGYDGIQDCSDINDRTERWVAGLNASESPPPEYGWHNDGDECIGPHCINMEHDDERDASESGQPPEDSDE